MDSLHALERSGVVVRVGFGVRDNRYNRFMIKDGYNEIWLDGHDVESLVRILLDSLDGLENGQRIKYEMFKVDTKSALDLAASLREIDLDAGDSVYMTQSQIDTMRVKAVENWLNDILERRDGKT